MINFGIQPCETTLAEQSMIRHLIVELIFFFMSEINN